MFSDKSKALSILENGAYEGAIFKSIFVTLAKYYKYLGYNKEYCKNKIVEWLENQICNDKFDDIMCDMNDAIKYVYSIKRIFIDEVAVNITLEEMLVINDIKNRNEAIVLFGMIYLSKIFAPDGGEFYITHNTIAKVTGFCRRYVIETLKKLEEAGYISIPTKNRTKKTIPPNSDWNGSTGKRYNYPNRYKVNISGSNVIYVIGDRENIINDLKIIMLECENKGYFKIKNLQCWCRK